MAYGLQVRDFLGGLIFDSNSFTARLIYQTTVSVPSAGGTYALPGFDYTKGVAWAEYTDFAGLARYTVNSNNTITIGYVGATRNVILYAVMTS